MKHRLLIGGWCVIDESGLQVFKGQLWKGLGCHDNTLIFSLSNYSSRMGKLEKTLELLQFNPSVDKGDRERSSVLSQSPSESVAYELEPLADLWALVLMLFFANPVLFLLSFPFFWDV